jgi:cytoskeletal protein RodZ
LGEFGDKFRKAREKKNISLDDVSNVTKISARMLQAIEEERFEQLPGGVFNKGFIRAYAKHLGINDQEAVSEYLECLREAQIQAQAVWEPPARAAAPAKPPLLAPSAPGGNGSTSAQPASEKHPPVRAEQSAGELPGLHLPRAEHVRPPRQKYLRDKDSEMPWRLVAVAALVVVLSVVLWRTQSHPVKNTTATAPPPIIQTVQPSPTLEIPAATALRTDAATPAGKLASTPAGTPAKAPVQAPAKSQPSKPGSDQNSGTAAPHALPPVASAHTPAPGPAKSDSDSDTINVTTRAVPASPTDSKPQPLRLMIRASENSWVNVTADGQTVSRETLIAPAHTSVRANNEIVVKIGNAAAVTFLWNGKEISAQGGEGEVKTFVFDAQGMHEIPPAPSPTQNR